MYIDNPFFAQKVVASFLKTMRSFSSWCGKMCRYLNHANNKESKLATECDINALLSRVLSSFFNTRNQFSDLFSDADEYDKPTSEMIDFEKALNAIIVQAEESKNNLMLMKVDQLNANYSFLNWTYFFKSAFNSIEEEKAVNGNIEILIQVQES